MEAPADDHHAELRLATRSLEPVLSELEADRLFLQDPVEQLRVPVEDSHRADWERRKRLQEIADLKVQLATAEDELRRQQKALLRLAGISEDIRSAAPIWEADVRQLRAVARPRVEGLSFSPGHLPEKVASFCPHHSDCIASSSSNSRKDVAKGVVMEYLPQDRQMALEQRMEIRRQCIKVQCERRTEACSTLEALVQTEAEEAALLHQVLREQLTRVKKRRHQTRAAADAVVDRHLRLKVEVQVAATKGDAEKQKLVEARNDLSSKLASQLLQRCAGVDSVGALGQQLVKRAAKAHESGVQRAREDAAFLREQIDAEEGHSAQRIVALEDQLGMLRERYENLEGSRAQELDSLRMDVEALQRATRQAEQLAARCVAWQKKPHSADARSQAQEEKRAGSCCKKCGCRCKEDEDARVEALALKPAVARLRKVMEACDHRLLVEETGGRIPEAAAQETESSEKADDEQDGQRSTEDDAEGGDVQSGDG